MNETSLFIGVGFAVLVAAIAIFDIYIIKKKGKAESISAHIIRGSRNYPLVVFLVSFALGLTAGHLFWSMDSLDWRTPEQRILYCKERCP